MWASEHSQALMIWSYCAMSSHECWWTPMAPWFHAHDCSWSLMCAHVHQQALVSIVLWCYEHSWVLMSAQSLMAPCSWLLLSSHKWSLLYGAKLMSVYGCSWVFNGNQEHSWLLMSAHDCSLPALMRIHEVGAMEQWALMRAQEQSWAWRHEALSAHQHSWVLRAP